MSVFSKNTALAAVLTIFGLGSAAQTKSIVGASDAKIQITGRVDRSKTDNVMFAFPGVSIKARFEGTSIEAVLTENGSGSATTTNYFNVIIDGGESSVLKLSRSQTIYPLASGLAEGTHTVELFKRTESNVGTVVFRGFRLDAGKKLLAPDPLPVRRIEFIGNSITCGYGNEVSTTTPDKFHFTSANENNYKAWGAVAARSLNAQYSCVAYSGRGLMQNNTGTKTGTLPQIYDQIIADDASTSWDHYNYTPDVIVINLGTNDFYAETTSATYAVDSATFVQAYISFVTKLRSYYPNASFVCCVGVMMGDSYPAGKKQWTRIQNYVSSVSTYFKSKGDAKVHYLMLPPQSAPYGEDWHPTAATDKKMADQLTAFIEKNISWTDCPASVSLGSDINLKYSPAPVVLSSQSSTNTNITYSWYKDGELLANETSPSYTINDTVGATGTYRVVRDSIGCRYEDEIRLSNAIQQAGTVCNWQDNKKAAVVLTFDDWSAGHPAIVVPELKKRGMVATFYPIMSWNNNWTVIAQAVADGNEIGNHSKTHPHLGAYTSAQLDGEIGYADTEINKNLTSQTVSTFDYPFGETSATMITYLKKLRYVAARGVQSPGGYSYNFAPTVDDYYKLSAFGMTGKESISTYASPLRSIISGGGLLIYLYHSVNSPTVTDNNYAAVAQSAFQYQLDTIQSLKNKLWVTTLSNSIKYHREAGCASLTQIEAPSAEKWVMELTDTLSDNTIYNQPLSIILRLNGRPYDMIQQDGKLLKVDSIYNDTIMFRAVPDKGYITLSVSGMSIEANVSAASATNTVDIMVVCGAKVTSAAGIKEVVADLSAIGGASAAAMTLKSNDVYTVNVQIPAAAPLGYKAIKVTATDNNGNMVFANTGITITSGIVIEKMNVYQNNDSISFSIVAYDDASISKVAADLTAVKGTAAAAMRKMDADSFYVAVSRTDVATGTKSVTFTLTDGTGNYLRKTLKFTVNELTSEGLAVDGNVISLSPNPATEKLLIATVLDITEIQVFNASGTQLMCNPFSNEIDILHLPEGVYTCRFLIGSESITRSFVKSKTL